MKKSAISFGGCGFLCIFIVEEVLDVSTLRIEYKTSPFDAFSFIERVILQLLECIWLSLAVRFVIPDNLDSEVLKIVIGSSSHVFYSI